MRSGTAATSTKTLSLETPERAADPAEGSRSARPRCPGAANRLPLPVLGQQPWTVELLLEQGFSTSSLMGNDFTPHWCRTGDVIQPDGPYLFGSEVDLVEMPVSWILDDFPHFEYVSIRSLGVNSQDIRPLQSRRDLAGRVHLHATRGPGWRLHSDASPGDWARHRMLMLKADRLVQRASRHTLLHPGSRGADLSRCASMDAEGVEEETVALSSAAADRPAWYTDDYPELRSAPPWVTEEMVASQPGLVAPILAHPQAELAQVILDVDEPESQSCGCGTSEHGAMAVAELLDAALRQRGARGGRIEVRQALEAALDPRPGGLCIAVTESGGTRATLLAVEAARDAGRPPPQSRLTRMAPPSPRSTWHGHTPA